MSQLLTFVSWLTVLTRLLPNPGAALAADPPVRDWPVELSEALAAYRADDFDETRRRCDDFAGADARLRREAAALETLCQLRTSEGRNDRLDACARLALLAKEDPTLDGRAECHLAYGICQTGLFETADALDHLDRAVTAFRAADDPARVAAALLALAEAWAVHAEWERLDPRFKAPPRPSPTEAHDVRRARMASARADAAELPDGSPTAERIDVVIAGYLLSHGLDADAALATLTRLATDAPRTPAAIAAALRLALRYEAEERWSAALALYERVATGASISDASAAALRIAAIRQPQVELIVPRVTAANSTVEIGLRSRNVPVIDIEVRRLDLKAWLARQRGRFVESQLHSDGAVQLSRALTPPAVNEHAWWDAAALPEPLRVAPPPGAYVVTARFDGPEGQARTLNRLLIVSDLRAAAFIGRRDALLWATGAAAPWTGPAPTAEFWMHWSFVPTRPAFNDGLARFPLPNEARLLRDKRWTCLVEAGDHFALCEGALPIADAHDESPTRVALLGAPAAPAVGQTVHLAGVLFSESGFASAAQMVQLDVLDVLDRLCFRGPAEVSPEGIFARTIPVTPDMSGKELRVIVRLDGRVLEQARGRFSFRVPAADETPLSAEIRIPPRLPTDVPFLSGRVTAAYPWGAPAAGARVALAFRAVELGGPAAPGVPPPPIIQRGALDAAGHFDFTLPLSDLGVAAHPFAIGVWARVSGWDERNAFAAAETLVCDQRVFLRAALDPPSPAVGTPLRILAAWLDPAQEIVTPPSLAIILPDGSRAEIPLFATPTGLGSPWWTPSQPGRLEAVLTAKLRDGTTPEHRVQFEVAPAVSQRADAVCLIEARYTNLPPDSQAADGSAAPQALEVRLRGQVATPLLIIAESGEPLGATTLPELRESAMLRLPLTAHPAGAVQVSAHTIDAAGPSMLARSPVAAGAATELRLLVQDAPRTASPGQTINLRVRVRGAGDAPVAATVMARVIHSVDSGQVRWLPGQSRVAQLAFNRGLSAFGSAEPGPDAATVVEPENQAADHLDPGARDASLALNSALHEGVTLALASHRIAGADEFTVTLPSWPGRYRILLAARTADGRWAFAEAPIDASAGLHAALDLPTRLQVGDRTPATLALHNESPNRVSARVMLTASESLHIDEVRAHSGGRLVEPAGAGPETTVELLPFGRMTLNVFVEAVRPGASALSATVATDDTTGVVKAEGTVSAAPPPVPSDAADVRIRRTLLHIKRAEASPTDAPPVPQGGVDRGATGWQYEVLAAGDAIPFGSVILVREEVSLSPGAALELSQQHWRQPLPPCFFPIAPGSVPEQPIGRIAPPALDQIEWQTDRLTQRAYRHEYAVVAVRPGVYQIPAPELGGKERRLSVSLDPLDLRIRVTDPATER